MTTTSVPAVALEITDKAQCFTKEPIAAIERITDGSINETYEVTTIGDERFILQKMSSIFPPAVMENLALVQPELQDSNVTVPEGMQAITGEGYVVNGGGRWYRALTHMPGRTIHDHITPKSAESSGDLIGRFHNALINSNVALHTAIKHFHETEYYMNRLERVVAEHITTEKSLTLEPLYREIMKRYQELPDSISEMPSRIIHGDLKVSNIRFNESGEAVALIDMDTLMHGSVAVDMGDALRSFCGTAGEDNAEQVFDEEVCLAALTGYRLAATAVTSEEIEAILHGISLLTLELAARFTMDAYEETYFAQSSKYVSLYEQNKTRAENQLHFLQAYEAKRHLLAV